MEKQNVIAVSTNFQLEKKRIALSRSKKVKSGFWCVACALDKHVITDREVIDFLKGAPTQSFRYRPRVEHVRY